MTDALLSRREALHTAALSTGAVLAYLPHPDFVFSGQDAAAETLVPFLDMPRARPGSLDWETLDAWLTPQDQVIAQHLRAAERRIFVCVNKAEGMDRSLAAAEFHELGLGEPWPISAAHGDGVPALVDALLAAGNVTAAEARMAEVRDQLAAQGTEIRRLNQAYFAWYGTYAARPDSVDPLGTQLRTLRQQTGSLAAFLERVRETASRAEIAALLD